MLISGAFSMVLDLSGAHMNVYINKKLYYYCIQASCVFLHSGSFLLCSQIQCFASPFGLLPPLHAAAQGELGETPLLTFKEVVTPSTCSTEIGLFTIKNVDFIHTTVRL